MLTVVGMCLFLLPLCIHLSLLETQKKKKIQKGFVYFLNFPSGICYILESAIEDVMNATTNKKIKGLILFPIVFQ